MAFHSFFFIIMSLTVSACVVNTASTTNDNPLESRNARDDLQRNGEPISDKWKYLIIEKSDAVVVGKVEEIRWVAKPEDIKSLLSYTGNDLSEIAPKKFVKGVLVKLLVTEVLDKHDNVEVGKIVDLYIEDGYAPPTDTDIPIFIHNKSYLAFLSAAKPIKKFEEKLGGFVTFDPSNLKSDSVALDLKSIFQITSNRDGRVELSESTLHMLEEVRKLL